MDNVLKVDIKTKKQDSVYTRYNLLTTNFISTAYMYIQAHFILKIYIYILKVISI